MATSAAYEALRLTGNLNFGDGGVSVDFLVGSFIKSAILANGIWTLTFQDASGMEETSTLPAGWVPSATELSNPYKGLGWYDTTANLLKIYNGTSFESLTGVAGSLADLSVTTAKLATDAVTAEKLASDAVTAVKIKDDAVTTDKIADNAVTSAQIADNAVGTNEIENDKVTTAKLDAGTEVKQDAFLTRINALRRDLDNIATLTIAEQRTLLLSLGSLIDGPRPAPSAAYAGRTWIDDHDDRAYVCRNRQEVSSAVGGLWADANTTTAGVEIAENLGDLDDSASVNDYAYTYADNKWWRGAVHNSQNVWRETQPTTALSGVLTLTPNWNTVWLGQHRWDYNATQQLPHSALPANTDYYFYNNRTVTVRKFKRADYSAAGTVFDHWQWESLVATAAEIDIIEARDGNLPALASDGTDDRQIAVANDGLHFVRLVPEAATAATVGTWTSYVFSKSNPTRAYIGVVSTDDPTSGTVGDFYYNSTFHRWRIYAAAGTWAWFNDHWEDLSDEDTAWPVRFVGHHATRAEAVAYAASSGIKTGQTFVAFTGTEIETASQFDAGTSARFSRHWRFLPVGAAGAPTIDNNDYLNALAFAVTSGVVSAKATLHDGDEVKATGADLLAPLASPVFTGTPTADTAPLGTNTKQLATTAFVKAASPSQTGEDAGVGSRTLIYDAAGVGNSLTTQVGADNNPHLIKTFTVPSLAVNEEFNITLIASIGNSQPVSSLYVTLGSAVQFITDGTSAELLSARTSGVGLASSLTAGEIVREASTSNWISHQAGDVTFTLVGAGATSTLAITFTELKVYVTRPQVRSSGEDATARADIATEAKARSDADIAEALVRGNADTALGTRITNAGNTSDDADTVLDDAATALGKRIDALVASSGLVDTTIFDGDVSGSNSNVLRQLYQGASPPVTDNIVVPETGDLLFIVYSKNRGFSGHFQIAAKDFITKTGVSGGVGGQGDNAGFAFPIGQNKSFTVTHRVVSSVKRFLWATQYNVNLTWHLKIIHLTPAKPSTPSRPNYKPGLAPFRFVGLDRTAAIAAREKYFAGVISLSQAYVNIFSAGMTSYIQVMLHSPPIEQVGAAGNDWNLVLGTDHTNTSVTISPNTPGKTFTLRLPDAGITLDALAADLDSNSRLNAQVVGDGNALVDYTATWGSNPTVGSASPFSHGGDQIITERTAWRAEYIANPNFVLVLDYGILEEYQHWAVAVAPAVSDWETVLTLIKPPVADYSPGLIPNTFRGANRAAAAAALDEYVDGVSLITQASLRIYSNANNYLTVTLNAVVAVGTKGNKWSLRWGGDSASSREIDLNTVDSLFRATLKWDSNNSTLADLHAEFNRDSKFSSVVTGDDALVASINETFGSDVIGNTVFFTGGLRTHTDTHVWFSHYADDPVATVTLEYESRQEMQVWDAALENFRTVFILLDSPTKPNPWTVLTHPNISTENWQWTLSATADEQELKERSGGTVKLPTSPSDTDAVQLAIPTDSKEIYVRLTNGDEIDAAYIPMIIIAPDNAVVEPHVSLVLSYTTMILRISLSGHVYVKRAISGTTVVGCDIWYR